MNADGRKALRHRTPLPTRFGSAGLLPVLEKEHYWLNAGSSAIRPGLPSVGCPAPAAQRRLAERKPLRRRL